MSMIKWHATVKEMPHNDGFSYPVFEWSYGSDLLRGGEIRVWSLQRSFSHLNRREHNECTTDAEGALEFANRMGWEQPPNFFEVYEAMMMMPGAHNQEEAVKGFDDLKKTWEGLV